MVEPSQTEPGTFYKFKMYIVIWSWQQTSDIDPNMHVADLGLYQSTTVDLSYTQLTPSLASSCHLTKATMLRSNLLCDVNLKSAFGLKLSSWAMTTRFILWLAQPPDRSMTAADINLVARTLSTTSSQLSLPLITWLAAFINCQLPAGN